MRILAIETSCDETAVAVVEDGWKVLCNVIASSLNLHQLTGGIVPEVAARAHVESIVPALEEVLNQMAPGKTRNQQVAMIDQIAVTSEPGLVTSLLVGTETAKWLAYLWEKPLLKVNHIHGHVAANWLERDPAIEPIAFPLVCLSVSGGHNELILMKQPGEYEIIGQSQDDAAGEAFDKVARILGLGYPGGPVIEAFAEKFQFSSAAADNFQFPRAWMNSNASDKWDGTSFDFSFSGLKSEVLREVQKRGDLEEENRVEIAYAFQEAVFDVLVTKLIGAAEKFNVKEIHIAGGVSANKRFRSLISE
ncbi:MAG: tRNA (adenosine(37)-N6)-threonylcarbamoyltransferase complex transferase subunit TsaD, partial [Candidatus Gracilibacteria bacterium]|nr:tRNA (adenosine(37)-N6)-threonylcarbamoyltransferase complex transferase subunit TsaD [Candidatus Gracilibacteria bacterium]